MRLQKTAENEGIVSELVGLESIELLTGDTIVIEQVAF